MKFLVMVLGRGSNKNFFLMLFVFFLLFCPSRSRIFAPVLLDYKIVYPDIARQMGIEGKAVLGLLINEEGRVEQVKLLKSSSNDILDSAALETAHTFIFSPALANGKPVKIWVSIPVEFRFEEIKPDLWLMEVKELQSAIAKEYKEGLVYDLYKLYKKLIFSPKKTLDIKVNEYIKLAVLDKTAKLWDGYWKLYPATLLLFVDIIYRYPDSFARFEAEEELKKFLEQEEVLIRTNLNKTSADTLIFRMRQAIGKP
jgi:TonB family protein